MVQSSNTMIDNENISMADAEKLAEIGKLKGSTKLLVATDVAARGIDVAALNL